MTLGFATFLTLAALTIASQVLSSRTQPGIPAETAFLNELASLKDATDKKLVAEAAYREAADLLLQNKLDEAIRKLNASIEAAPTLAARETLIYVYVLVGNTVSADKAREAALKVAQERGDTLALVRLQRSDALDFARLERNYVRVEPEPSPLPTPDANKNDPTPEPVMPKPVQTQDTRTPLPRGGQDIKSSVAIEPGRYICANETGCDFSWFSMSLQSGQEIELMVRGPQNGEYSFPRMEVFDENGRGLPYGYVGDISRGLTFNRVIKIPSSKVYFLEIKTERDAILDIFVR